ncbi:E3 ubiquitin-protein ligase TRIM39-like isoform X1 [Anguilla rostrata]|uniref:E3 ubiquitin-protein ligase TRIM39-like isoform X1 n=1 Tax=Anguilla rostrata TaxID=7938 RepID=UPI0030CED73C
MALPNILVLEEQFRCSICLDVFNDPVSTPCGHNFCMACIGGYWDSCDLPQCPLCKETFETRPHLCVNKSFAEIVEQFKSSADVNAKPSGTPPTPTAAGVLCDICTEEKLKAVKSCLTCLTSYCGEHISLHRFNKHTLSDPVSMEGHMCKQHERLLEVFCQTDETCICALCAEKDHRTHDTILVERACEEKRIQFGKVEEEINQMIQERIKKVEDVKRTAELSKTNAQKEIEDSEQVLNALRRAIERSQSELVELIKEKQDAAEKWAKGFIEKLEREIAELRRRNAELKQLSHSEDYIHILRSFPSLCTISHIKSPSDVTVYADPCLGTVQKMLLQLVELISEEEKRFSANAIFPPSLAPDDVTLDPATAHPCLVLSSDKKNLWLENAKQDVPDNPERFDLIVAALGEQNVSSGRHYWELEVGDKTEWNVGVAAKSVDRKGSIVRSPDNGFWTLWLINGNEYYAYTDPPVQLAMNMKPKKIGVYVDYEEGCISFYNVEAKLHIYTFSGCSFKENVYPYFNTGVITGDQNMAPLIISPVVPKE